MTSTTAPMTAADLLKMPEDDYRYELVRGELIKMSKPGYRHGKIAGKFWKLGQYVEENNLGVFCAAETGFQLEHKPDTVRAPDVAFISRERIEQIGEPEEGYWQGAPDLAVEVISPNDTYTEVEDKVFKWLTTGARMIIVVNPRNHTVAIYRPDKPPVRLTEDEVLEGGEVVPGWTMPVRDLFR